MEKIYALVWTSQSLQTIHEVLFRTRERAQSVADKTNAEIPWWKRRLFALKWIVREYKLED